MKNNLVFKFILCTFVIVKSFKHLSIMKKSFQYLGKTFTPVRKMTKRELNKPCNICDSSLDEINKDFNHKDFYITAGEDGSNIDIFEMDGLLVIPCDVLNYWGYQKPNFHELNKIAKDGSLSDDLNPLFIFSFTNNQLLCDIVTGKIDVIEFAKHELQSRGFDENNKWIGFKSK